nr:reverse transcriptase domain-containing protein [Tanacetum cinerariifolium]
MMKFPTPKGVAMLVTRTLIIAKCRLLKKKQMVEGASPKEKGEVAVTEEVLVKPLFLDQPVNRPRTIQSRSATPYYKTRVEHESFSESRVPKAKNIFNREERGGRNLEAYVDDMVIKSRDEKMLLADISKTFDNLKKINMKLNPKKCSFRVEEGKFSGYMETSEGIRANLRKTKALADLQSPRMLKEMQSLRGKLAALNQFLAKSTERSLPFFNTLKNITKENKHEYWWTQEAEEAFQQMKKLITD